MRIIDLLNLIAKGEEVPKKIKFKGEEYMFYGINYTTTSERKALHRRIELNNLNDEVEIIEEEKEIEKKIEKIIISMDDVSMPYVTNNKYQRLSYSEVDLLFASKINELIDVINDMRDKE